MTNGSYQYEFPPDGPGAEKADTRREREQFWRSLGKKIRAGARIP